jgi:hypothetical protein
MLLTSFTSGIVPAAQQVLREFFLEPFKDFRYNNAADPSKEMPLSSGFSQMLLISLYLATVWLARRHFHGVLKNSAGFLKLAVAHNTSLALVSLVLLLMLADQVPLPTPLLPVMLPVALMLPVAVVLALATPPTEHIACVPSQSIALLFPLSSLTSLSVAPRSGLCCVTAACTSRSATRSHGMSVCSATVAHGADSFAEDWFANQTETN